MTKSWRFACRRIFILFSLISGSLPVCAQVAQQDYDALVALYNSTNGTSWNNNSGWLGPNDATVANWFGVTVEDGRVVQISLRDNNLTGTLPPEIGDLTAIRFLLLGPDQPPFSNQIGGSIPAEIGNLTNLVRLNLQFNAFTGTLPTELSNLVNLVRLELSANQLSGTLPSFLGSLSELQHLSLGVNQFTGNLPVELGQLSKLTWLSVANNQFTGSIPATLGDLALLETLQLQLNAFSGSLPEELKNLTVLRQFYFFSNNLSGGLPSWIGELPLLQALQGQSNPLGGTLPATLGNLSNLTTLTFSNCQLTGVVPASMANLSSLTILGLQGNFFTALPDLSGISGLNGLTNFQIQNNNLTFESIEPHVAQNPTYAPQRQLAGIADFGVNSGEPISLSYTVGGSANNYQWYKDNAIISGANASTYTIPSAEVSDAGVYYLEITNSIATALTLRTGNTMVSVNDISALQWVKVDIGSPNGLLDIQFADERAGFTGGDNGAFFRTTDGGETWEDLTESSGLTGRIFDVHFLDRHRGWVVGNQGLIARTENGGLNWTITPFSGVSINTVWFIDEDNGWLGYGNGNVFRTVNGGISWTSQPTGTSAIIDEIQFVNDQVGYIACASSGSGGRILKTTNGGNSWDLIDPGTGSLNGLFFFDEDRGFVGGLNGFLHSTPDGGQSFVSEGRPSSSTIHAIDFATENIGWFSGLNNTLYSTANGGATWVRETTELIITDQIRRVHSVRPDFAWACSFPGGFLLKYGQAGNVIVPGYETAVQRNVTSTGTFDFNEGSDRTYVQLDVQQITSPGVVTVTLQQEAPSPRQHTLMPLPQFANLRWSVVVEAGLPNGYEISFDLETMPGLPIHESLNNFIALKRDQVGTGTFTVAPSRVENGKLIVQGTGNHEFAIVMVEGAVVASVEICLGEDAVFTAGGAKAGETYNWYANSGDVTPLFTGNPLIVPSPSADATYYVAITDGVNEGVRVSAALTVKPTPIVQIDSTTDESVCLGTTGSISFTFTNIPDGTYAITYDAGSLTNVAVTLGSATVQVDGGDYNNLQITLDGCTSAAGVDVTIQSNTVIPDPPLADDAYRCGDGMITLQASGASGTQQYRWFADADGEPIAGATGATFTTPALSATTVYYVAVADGDCESDRVSIQAEIRTIPDAPVASGVQSCVADSFTVTPTGATAGQVYAWYADQSAIDPLQQSADGVFVTPLLSVSTTYFVSILDQSCSSPRVAVEIEITNLPAPEVTSQSGFGFCEGASLTLEGPEGFDAYLWTGNSTDQDLTVDAGGSYTLIVYDENGCASLPTTVQVTMHPLPEASINFSNDRLTAGQAAAYQWYLFDEVIAGATESFLSINVLRYGIYSVKLISNQGCEVISDPFIYLITGPEIIPGYEVRIFPNPSSDKLNINLVGDETTKTWKIFDSRGSLVFSNTGVALHALDITDWSSGLYTIRIETAGRVITRKFVKP